MASNTNFENLFDNYLSHLADNTKETLEKMAERMNLGGLEFDAHFQEYVKGGINKRISKAFKELFLHPVDDEELYSNWNDQDDIEMAQSDGYDDDYAVSSTDEYNAFDDMPEEINVHRLQNARVEYKTRFLSGKYKYQGAPAEASSRNSQKAVGKTIKIRISPLIGAYIQDDGWKARTIESSVEYRVSPLIGAYMSDIEPEATSISQNQSFNDLISKMV